MATKLNQIIAVQKGVKSSADATLAQAYHDLQKAPLLSGISRKYTPRNEEGEQLPPESTRVQLRASDAIAQVTEALTRLFDVEATKEEANTRAKANIVVGDTTILTDVPATTLLFIEKKLVDIRTFIAKLPTLDPSETWAFDGAQDVYRTDAVFTLKTKKTPKNHVKAEATQHHPAQVEVYYEDEPQGTWATIKYSGALPAQQVNEMLARVDALQQAVKFAREAANNVEVKDQHVGKAIFGYLFA
ncbi:MAG: DUF7873 family protein [Ktedonobacterales bacterium]